MARYESILLGDCNGDSMASWTSEEGEPPFTVRDAEGNTITLEANEARDLAQFLVRWLFEYLP